MNHLLSPQLESEASFQLLGQIDLPGPTYQVFLLDFQGETIAPGAHGDMERLMERGFSDLMRLRAISIPVGLVAVVACPECEADAVLRRCSSLVSALRTQGHQNAVLALGGVHEGAQGVHTSYAEAYFALEFSVIHPQTQILPYQDFAGNGMLIVPKRCAELLKALPETMRRRNAGELRRWSTVFLAAAEEDSINPVSFKHTVARFVGDAGAAALAMRINLGYGDRDFHNAIWMGKNRHEIERVFHDGVEYVCQALTQQSLRPTSRIRGEKLLSIVERSIFKPELSLPYVADAFGTSPAHASRLFKETVGCSFQEYVAQKRIDAAQDLLRDSHKNVVEVARDVGFLEVHTLIRLFKKKTGMTPLEYRKNG
jgi:two-component system response regulator YesN